MPDPSPREGVGHGMRLAFPIEKNGGGLEFGLHHPFYKKEGMAVKKKIIKQE